MEGRGGFDGSWFLEIGKLRVLVFCARRQWCPKVMASTPIGFHDIFADRFAPVGDVLQPLVFLKSDAIASAALAAWLDDPVGNS